jgi:hypothetical protein
MQMRLIFSQTAQPFGPVMTARLLPGQFVI